jgi:hypothetical protein
MYQGFYILVLISFCISLYPTQTEGLTLQNKPKDIRIPTNCNEVCLNNEICAQNVICSVDNCTFDGVCLNFCASCALPTTNQTFSTTCTSYNCASTSQRPSTTTNKATGAGRCNMACNYYSCKSTLATCVVNPGDCSDDGVCFKFNASCVQNSIVVERGYTAFDCHNKATGAVRYSLAVVSIGYFIVFYDIFFNI